MRPPSGRAAPVTGRPHTNAGAAPKPQRVEEKRRNVTGWGGRRQRHTCIGCSPVNVPARPG